MSILQSTADLIRSLRSGICPACGAGKKRRNTFCGDCYYKLDRPLQAALYKPVGGGYETAVNTALRKLRPGEVQS